VGEELGIDEGDVDTDGSALGRDDGIAEGDADIDGTPLGVADGIAEGTTDGETEGARLGESEMVGLALFAFLDFPFLLLFVGADD
jgi:hypothetical protein